MASPAPMPEEGGQCRPVVFECPQALLELLATSALERLSPATAPGTELYGVLLGTRQGFDVSLVECRVIGLEVTPGTVAPLAEQECIGFRNALEAALQNPGSAVLEPVGWFRAHPCANLDLSARDLEIANTFFPARHHVTMILRPGNSLPAMVRVFYRESDGPLNPASPFRELHLPAVGATADHADSMPDVVSRRKKQLAARDSHAGGQVDLAPPESSARQERLIPSTAGRVPSRKVNLFVSAAVAIGLGLLTGTYWLLATPEKLVLRMADSAGQLRIEWGPVRNATFGHLEIKDSGGNAWIELDADQLRNCNYTYARKSGNVEVRLAVNRNGAEPLTAASGFRGPDVTVAVATEPSIGGAPLPESRFAETPRVTTGKSIELAAAAPLSERSRQKAGLNFTVPDTARPKPTTLSMEPAPPLIVAQNPGASGLPGPVQMRIAASPVAETAAEKAAAVNPPAGRPAAVNSAEQTAGAQEHAALNPPAEGRALSQPAVARVPATPNAPSASAMPSGVATPSSGRIIWVGQLPRNQDLVIRGNSCSTGTLIGELPGKAIRFSVSPGGLSADGIVLYTANPEYANNVVESPGARNGWNKTVYAWNPKYAGDVTIQDAPAPQNQWNRLVLRSRNPKISVLVIDWTLAN